MVIGTETFIGELNYVYVMLLGFVSRLAWSLELLCFVNLDAEEFFVVVWCES